MSYEQARKHDDRTIRAWAIRGHFVWTWREASALITPIPCPGMPGLWELPAEVDAAVLAAPKVEQQRITFLDNEGEL